MIEMVFAAHRGRSGHAEIEVKSGDIGLRTVSSPAPVPCDGRSTPASPSLKEALLAEIPALRAFAISLTRNVDSADDLVQETLMRAWAASASYTRDGNFRAWLFTILRNALYSQYRRHKREVPDVDGLAAARLVSQPAQQGHVDLADFRRLLEELPIGLREALLLVGASGFSCLEAAEICDCPVGTIKSRVRRARRHLSDRLGFGALPSDAG